MRVLPIGSVKKCVQFYGGVYLSGYVYVYM